MLSFDSWIIQLIFNEFAFWIIPWTEEFNLNLYVLAPLLTFHVAFKVYYKKLTEVSWVWKIDQCVVFLLTAAFFCFWGSWSIVPSSIPMSPGSRFMNTLRPRKRSLAAAAISKTPSSICTPTTNCQETHQERRWVGVRAVKLLQFPGCDVVTHSSLEVKNRLSWARRFNSTTGSNKCFYK